MPQVNPGVTTVLKYLLLKFPTIAESRWRERMAAGKHRDEDMQVIAMGQVVI
ncbi:hypothetical protein HHA02_29500 [Cobetia marina]|nr:hypothetical protein HHA02_29500 [Cobetia marina]